MIDGFLMKANLLTKSSCQTPWILLGVFIALATFMAGCATVPGRLQAMKENALSLSPPPGKAGVYVIREFDSAIGATAGWPIELDSNRIGSVQLRSYLYGVVSPGNHLVRIRRAGILPLSEAAKKDREFRFAAEAGRNYFFTIVLSGLSSHFYLMPATAGAAYVRNFNLVAGRFELPDELMDFATADTSDWLHVRAARPAAVPHRLGIPQ